MASLKDLASRVKEYLTPKPLVSPIVGQQPVKRTFANDNEGWIRQGRFTPIKNISEKVTSTQPYKNLSTSLDILTNPSQTANRKLLIQGLQIPEPGRAPAAQKAINFLTNVAAMQTGGIKDIRSGVEAFKNKEYLQSVVKPAFGVAKIATSGLPPSLVANLLSSNTKPVAGDKYDLTRRLSSGYLSGMSGENLGTNVADKNIKVLGSEFDPVKGVGSLAGFTKNPLWSTIFGKTQLINKFAPATKGVLQFIASRGVKGGVEGWIQALNDVPVNADNKTKADIFLKNIAFGAASEIVTDAGSIALKNLISKLTPQAKQQLGNAITESQKSNKKVKFVSPSGEVVYENQKPTIFEQGQYLNQQIEKNIPGADQGFGNIAKPVGGNDAVMNAEIAKGLTPEVTTSKPQIDLPQNAGVDTQASAGQLTNTTTKKLKLKTDKVLSTSSQDIIPPNNATPEQVASTLPSRIDNFVNKVLGYSTEAPKGGTKEASLYTRTLRNLENKFTTGVETAMGSENSLIRNAATNLQNLFRGAGMSQERSTASMELRGGMATANERAFNIMDSLYKSLKNDKKSLERINAVLDPSLSKNKVSLNDLSPVERQVYEIIREGLDLVHDTSYANGHISSELYSANRGKYVPRLYEITESPPEVSSFLNQGKKLANDLYKSRKDIDEWKIENSLNDPVYGLGKRLAQVETNKAIKQYTDFLASSPNLVSDVEKPGFIKLSDSKAYGNLSGKYVLNSAAEDLKGFFFSNQAMQNIYDVFRAYDRMPIRQLQKKLLTVFNPTTNVGNIVSDQVFGFVTGVDPLTLNANLLEFKSNPKMFKELNDYLLRKGVTGTDITRTDFTDKMGSINDLALGKKKNIITRIADKQTKFYGGTDDAYKISAFKALLDKGFTLEEATRKVADGFQNYANVGKFYDLWAKTPVIGSTFIKFQGDLMRIIKNGAVNNPLGLISFLGTLWGVARLFSKISGETDENREYRENRFGAPMIPGLKIPLTWQTPMGEINAARYISPFFANNDVTNLGKMLPFFPNIDTKKDVASNIAMNANDPLLSPLVNLAVNRDFRGKPISDPKENKYQPSTLTPEEKLQNQAIFAGRAYTPPPINSAIDVYSASQGRPNMYGAKQSTKQAIARLGGIKVSQFGPEEVAQAKQKDAEYQSYKNESINKQINSVYKQQLKGEITPEQVDKRVKFLESQKKETLSTTTEGRSTGSSIPVYRYLDDNGDMRTIDISQEIPEPNYSGVESIDKKLKSAYKGDLTRRGNDVVKLYEKGQINEEQAKALLDEIEIKYDSTLAPKKPKKPKSIKIRSVKYNTPKLTKTARKSAPKISISTVKLPKSIKRNITISKPKQISVKGFKNTLSSSVKLA